MSVVDPKNQQAIHTIFITTENQNDQALFSAALEDILPSSRIEVQKNSKELFSLLQFLKPDLLFLGMDLYFKSCLECIMAIRSNNKLNDIPIIVFDDTARTSNIEASYEMGADLFFVKPSASENLSQALGGILALDWTRPAKVKEAFTRTGRGAFGL